AHKNSGVRVVEQIAGKVRQLQNDLFGDGGVPFGWDKYCKAWRGEQRRNEIPSRRCAPWPSHDARVGCYAQKLIEDRPSGVPCIRSRPLAFEPVAAGGMKLRIHIGGVDQHIGVDGEHYRPSMAWYRASRSAISTSAPPLRNFGRAGILPRFR